MMKKIGIILCLGACVGFGYNSFSGSAAEEVLDPNFQYVPSVQPVASVKRPHAVSTATGYDGSASGDRAEEVSSVWPPVAQLAPVEKQDPLPMMSSTLAIQPSAEASLPDSGPSLPENSVLLNGLNMEEATLTKPTSPEPLGEMGESLSDGRNMFDENADSIRSIIDDRAEEVSSVWHPVAQQTPVEKQDPLPMMSTLAIQPSEVSLPASGPSRPENYELETREDPSDEEQDFAIEPLV